MSVRFTLENRTNKFGECPIRLSWSFGGLRYQTTIGFSVLKETWDEKSGLVKHETHNHSGQTADDINFYLKRISLVATGIEQHFAGNEKTLTKNMMKHTIDKARGLEIARPEDVIERLLDGWGSVSEKEPAYYRGPDGKYYKLICDAKSWYNTDRFYVLQQLFGRRDRILVPEFYFRSFRHPGNKYSTIEFRKVNYEDVYGQ